PDAIESTVYYVVSEALTNAAKHARASTVDVTVAVGSATVEVLITDDGVGGADLRHGSGLIGLRDRVEAVGGSIEMDSPVRVGATLRVQFPATAPGGVRLRPGSVWSSPTTTCCCARSWSACWSDPTSRWWPAPVTRRRCLRRSASTGRTLPWSTSGCRRRTPT